jgi:hypothetical protein
VKWELKAALGNFITGSSTKCMEEKVDETRESKTVTRVGMTKELVLYVIVGVAKKVST